MTDRSMAGKVALVTGGASGIGRIVAGMFAHRGARVVVTTDKNIQGGEETIQSIRDAGGEATFIRCDVSKAESVEALVAQSVEAYGSLDYAFNNAGIGPDGKRVPIVPIAECPEEIWQRTIDINLTGVFYCLKYEIRQMLKQKSGAIVNTSSVGALKPPPGFSAYSASKLGLHALTKTAALENAKYGIRVNAICPGPTERTVLVDNITQFDINIRKHMLEQIPVGRMATPEDMGEAVLWMCSDAASMITGHIMPVDGGMASQ